MSIASSERSKEIQGLSLYLRLLITAVLTAVLSLGCSDASLHEPEASELPDYPVAYRIDLLTSEGSALASPLTAILVLRPRDERDRLGVGGLIICHGLPGEVTEESYYAFDARCPLCYPTPGLVIPDESSRSDESLLSATCKRCGAVYDLTMGVGQLISDLSRKARLKRYHIGLSGRVLTIYN